MPGPPIGSLATSAWSAIGDAYACTTDESDHETPAAAFSLSSTSMAHGIGPGSRYTSGRWRSAGGNSSHHGGHNSMTQQGGGVVGGGQHVKLPNALQMQRPSTTPTRLMSAGSFHGHGGHRVLRPPLPSSMESGGLVIEGCQTGQVVCVESTPRRKSQAEQPPTPTRPRGEATAAAAERERERERREKLKDKTTIRKLEAEVKRLRQLLTEKDAEIADLRVKLADAELQAAQTEQSHKSELESMKEAVQGKAAELETLRSKMSKTLLENEALHKEIERQRVAAMAREKEMSAALGEMQEKLRQAHEKLQQTQQKEAQLSNARADMEKAAAAARRETNVELEQLKKKLEASMAETEAAKRKAQSLEDETQKARDVVDKYNKFIQRLCQPQFSVVKDESLTPVNPNGFHVVEGHVLVPLVLLLEGYAFLPNNQRNTQNVSDYTPPTYSRSRSRPGTAG